MWIIVKRIFLGLVYNYFIWSMIQGYKVIKLGDETVVYEFMDWYVSNILIATNTVERGKFDTLTHKYMTSHFPCLVHALQSKVAGLN
jgi:hypothetical protein